jgi:hypothetical protein
VKYLMYKLQPLIHCTLKFILLGNEGFWLVQISV